MIEMIKTDKDGTLLNSKKEISEENKKAVLMAHEKGIHFVLATGRMYSSARIFARQLDIRTPIISCNGALIRDFKTKETFFEQTLSHNTIIEIMNLLDYYKIYYHFYTDEQFYTKELRYTALNYWENNKIKDPIDQIQIFVDENLNGLYNEDLRVLKFVVIEDKDKKKLLEVRDQLFRIKGIELSQSWNNNIEIMAAGVSKGNAVRILSRLYEIDLKNAMSFGDQLNDISMLQSVGYGFAMGNADQEVKDCAKFMTDSNDDDGVAKAIIKYI